MTLLAINVGKADALLLSCGDDVWLIDTGTEENWGRLSAALRSLNVARLTGVILTHTDGDHAAAPGRWPARPFRWTTGTPPAFSREKKPRSIRRFRPRRFEGRR